MIGSQPQPVVLGKGVNSYHEDPEKSMEFLLRVCYVIATGCSSVRGSTAFGTLGSLVQIQSSRYFHLSGAALVSLSVFPVPLLLPITNYGALAILCWLLQVTDLLLLPMSGQRLPIDPCISWAHCLSGNRWGTGVPGPPHYDRFFSEPRSI